MLSFDWDLSGCYFGSFSFFLGRYHTALACRLYVVPYTLLQTYSEYTKECRITSQILSLLLVLPYKMVIFAVLELALMPCVARQH
ncbi:hypothetical protein GE09DRAFT_335838 [Coniochaeta sp. 2T2.1]|nr:hypothetical protein GE09DRAFT_335838 [Coniochaeta sp. 2T2.1]